MVHNIGKWEQAKLFMNDPILSRCFPTTRRYSIEELSKFLDSYHDIFLKPESGGQGRGIMRVSQEEGERFHITGYTLQGKPIDKIVDDLEELHHIIQPFAKLKRLQPYIIQERIKSLTPKGRSIGLRIHIQFVEGNWVVGGMLGKMVDNDDGIVNRHRGARAISVIDLLENHIEMETHIATRTVEFANFLSIQAAAVFANQYPWCLECGIDMGIDQEGKLWIFELNTTPSVAFFYQLEDKSIWRQIIANRKTRNQ